MLDDVVANFLGTLSETEFFPAFEAILRANGFYDVHRIHGPNEFGKDFVAKRVDDAGPTQYLIQTKAGNINTSGWHEVRDQIETIRLCTISHPSDDQSLPRRAVLALTGRLTGTAPAETQNYKQNYDVETFEFHVWQLDNLLSMMTDAPEVGLAGEPDAPLLGAVAAIFQGTFTETNLEALSREWSNPVGQVAGIWRCALTAFVLAHRLALQGRRDLAALTGVHLVRAAWARNANQEPAPEAVRSVAETGKGLLVFHGSQVYDIVKKLPDDPQKSLMTSASFGDFVVYPARCMRVLEIVGLLALATEDPDRRGEIAEFCADFVKHHPGASHPISDHWAVCIPPVAVLLRDLDRGLLGKWLEEICVWLLDHSEPGKPGLAAPWTAPDVEVTQLLLAGVPSVPARRRDSFLAAVLLDLAAALELPDVYDALVNDVMAAGIFPSVVQADETTGFYQDNVGDVFIEPWVQYDGHYADQAEWPCSEPHRNMTPSYLQRLLRPWDLLALSSVLRDRWWPLVWRDMAGLP